MFDIDEAIKQWRRKMQSAGINSPESLDELEAHLRDEVARQTKGGLSTRSI